MDLVTCTYQGVYADSLEDAVDRILSHMAPNHVT